MAKTTAVWAAGALLASCVLIAGNARQGAEAAPERPGDQPVVVELFTSEGCSSCPPADAVLARLQHEGDAGGIPIIALGEHVNYWDRNGWRDPYSQASLTARQSEYATAFHSDEVYTPQMIVGGSIEFTGSDEASARRAISLASRFPRTNVSETVSDEGKGKVTVRISASPAPPGYGTATVYAALAEDGLMSNVRGGENRGRKLSHVAVVRELSTAGTLTAKSGAFNGTISIPVRAGWEKRNLRVVAFVQDNATRRILGATERRLVP